MIEQERIYEELKELGKIGFSPGMGTSRVAYSPDFFRGRDFVAGKMEEAGLEIQTDGVGNLTGLWKGIKTGEKKILVGSHIDSVPGGGIFDGCLGVIGAIECIRALRREGYENIHPIEVAAFIEEEGNAIGGTFGSRCFIGGKITAEEKEKARAFHLTENEIQQAARNVQDYQAYLELHIEQGGILEKEKRDIGIVEGIVGIARYSGSVLGESNHAGTTPMELRDDAMMKSVMMLQDLFQQISMQKDGMVCTVGAFSIPEPAINVIPGKTEFRLEGRGPSLDELIHIIDSWREKYKDRNLQLEIFLEQKETKMDETLKQMIENVCQEEGFSWKRMYSGAGHDAMNLAGILPTGMIFIPSKDGVSHSEKEYSSMEAIGKGTQTLYQMIKKIDREL